MSVVAPPRMEPDLRARPAPPRPRQVRRRLGGISADDVRNLVGAAVTGVTVTMLLFRVAAFSGAIGFALVAFAIFVAAYATLVWLVEDGPAVPDKVMTALFYSAAAVTFSAL